MLTIKKRVDIRSLIEIRNINHRPDPPTFSLYTTFENGTKGPKMAKFLTHLVPEMSLQSSRLIDELKTIKSKRYKCEFV
jgi:hypothetical protein